MNQNGIPAALLTGAAAVLVATTLPLPAALVVATLAVLTGRLAAVGTRTLRLPMAPGTAALRASAAALVVIGGPVVAAVLLGARSVPLLFLACVLAVLLSPQVSSLWGARTDDAQVCGPSPANVRR